KRIAFLSQVWTDLETWDEMAARMKERAEPKMSARVWTKARISHWDRFLDERKTHVYAVSIAGGDPIPLTLESGSSLDVGAPGADAYHIAPHGTELACVADVDEAGIDPDFDVCVMPIDSGTPTNLTSDTPADDA